MGVLQGKIAIITGASSGIGKAAAVLFAAEGASVVLGARRASELKAVADEIRAAGGESAWAAGDVCDEGFARQLVSVAVARYGGVDVGFNNAGTLGAMGATPGLAVDGWRDTIDANLTSAFLAAKYQIPAMLTRGGGSLIFTSTFVGHTIGFPGVAPYAASKSGLIGLTQALASEFGPSGIRVNALLPGGTETPMAHVMNTTPDALAHVASLHALKRLAQPVEIARAALFLASEHASFMTGAAMLVDGGISVTRT
jgi:NAD(P)-dependent dehydrogenase (short-subunit alcohol dehydrogenase family)